MIAAVTKLRFGNLLGLAFDIRAGQVVKQHFVLRAEEVLPAGLQVREQSRAMRQQTVQH